jgi:hypothetical protein
MTSVFQSREVYKLWLPYSVENTNDKSWKEPEIGVITQHSALVTRFESLLVTRRRLFVSSYCIRPLRDHGIYTNPNPCIYAMIGFVYMP